MQITLTESEINSLRQCILFAAKNSDLAAMKALCALDDKIVQQIVVTEPAAT